MTQQNPRFDKLSRDDIQNTQICGGGYIFTVPQLEEEISISSEIGRKLKSIEKELDKY